MGFSLSDSLFASSSPTTRARAAQRPAASAGLTAGVWAHGRCRAGGTGCQEAGRQRGSALTRMVMLCLGKVPPDPGTEGSPRAEPAPPGVGDFSRAGAAPGDLERNPGSPMQRPGSISLQVMLQNQRFISAFLSFSLSLYVIDFN